MKLFSIAFASIPAMTFVSAVKDVPQDADDPLAMCPEQHEAVVSCYGDESKFSSCLDCVFEVYSEETLTFCDELGIMTGERYGSCAQGGRCEATCQDSVAQLSQCMLANEVRDEHQDQVTSFIENLRLTSFIKNLRLPAVTSDARARFSPSPSPYGARLSPSPSPYGARLSPSPSPDARARLSPSPSPNSSPKKSCASDQDVAWWECSKCCKGQMCLSPKNKSRKYKRCQSPPKIFRQ